MRNSGGACDTVATPGTVQPGSTGAGKSVQHCPLGTGEETPSCRKGSTDTDADGPMESFSGTRSNLLVVR